MTKIDRTALVTFWLTAFLVPLAIIPESFDSVAVKLLIFSVSGGLLLVMSGLRMFRNSCFPLGNFLAAGFLGIAFAVLHTFPGSGTGRIRIIQLLSAAAIFISLGIFSFHPRQLLLPLVAGGSVAVACSLVFPGQEPRLAGTFGNPNLAASFAAALIPGGMVLLRHHRWRSYVFAGIFCFLLVALIIKSGTRSVLLSLPAGVFTLLLLRWKRQLLVPVSLLFVALSLLILFASPSLPPLQGSLGARQSIWEGTSAMISERPISGWGTGSFQPLFPSYRNQDYALRGLPSNAVHAHSEPGELLAENGGAALIVWCLFWVLLFRTALKEGSSSLSFAALAGIGVALADSSVSVSMRWTSQMFLISGLAASAVSWKSVRLPRWASFPVLIGGMLLLFLGGGASLKMVEASQRIFQALELQNQGGLTDSVVSLCKQSIVLNPREPAPWFVLGNQYGIAAGSESDPAVEAEFIRLQLAAYDSLESRVYDYGWAVQNRAVALARLGYQNQALDEIIRILKTRQHLKGWAIENGIATVPLAGDEKALEFAGYLYGMILGASLEDSTSSEMLLSALGTVYAVAGVRAPGIIPSLDSLCVESFTSMEIINRLHREAEIAPDDSEMLKNYLQGMSCSWPEFEDGLYSPYRVALLCRMAADSGKVEYLEEALNHALLLHENCFFLGTRFPGGDFAFTAPAEISSSGDDSSHTEVLNLCLRYILEMNAFGERVRIRNTVAIHRADDTGVLFVSPENLYTIPGSDNVEFRIALEFSTAAVNGSMPEADREEIAWRFICFARELENELGADEARELITRATATETEYLSSGPFHPGVRAFALDLREAILR